MATPIAYPVYHNPIVGQVQSVAVPVKFANNSISPELWGIIHSSPSFTIRQHVKLLPKNCCSCPPCVQQENTYSVYAGPTADNQAELLRADEVSDDWNRCCCKPYHPLKLEVRQYIPLPGDVGVSDFSHLTSEIQNDFSRLTDRRHRATAVRDFYKQYPPLFTIVRNDGQRCCRFPCRWLSTFVCFNCCQDGAHVYAGGLNKDPENEDGRLPAGVLPAERLIGSVTQPQYGGCCIPFLELRDQADDAEPFGKVAGPVFFGGWSEMCFDFKFFVSRFTSERGLGDIGLITKRRPKSLANAAMELFTDADVYSVDFNSAANATAEQKLTVLSAQLLLDYMLFDGNTEKCKDTPEAVYCYCCYCSVIGAIIPCYIAIPKKSG